MQFNEKFLYHIWDAKHLLTKLKTISGKKLKFIFPGRFNTDSGPDFKNAIIELSGKRVKGDVEIEKETYNWKSHHHDENFQFNDVILHVVYEHNGKYDFTINENGENIEIFEMKGFLDTDISKLLKTYSTIEYSEKEKKCLLFKNLSSEKTQTLLSKLGKQRFEKKIKRFKAEHYFVDFDQLLFQGMMEALGYSKNKFQMLRFATEHPYKEYKNEFKLGLTKEEFIVKLFLNSGLIDHLPASVPQEFKLKWFEDNHSKLDKRQDFGWKLFRLRPPNHPVNRLLQISEFLYSSLETSIFHKILQLFSVKQEQFKIKDFKQDLYSAFQKRSEVLPQKYLLGKVRIDTILINIILPLVSVYADEKNYAELKELNERVYESYPQLAENYITKYMKRFISDELKKSIKGREIYQQGLIKLYFDFCEDHLCEGCMSASKLHLE